MIKILKSAVLLAVMLVATATYGQEKQKAHTFDILTSAECGTCKKILEDKLNYTKGIRFAELDVESKILQVSYNTKLLDENAVRQLVSDLGYDADTIPANATSQQELPKCCQPGGMKK